MRKGQGLKTFVGYPWSSQTFRWHCITHRHDSVIDINKWAQEYFQKSLSLNTIGRAICKCQLKLYQAKRKPFMNMVQKRHRVLWAKAHLRVKDELKTGALKETCPEFYIINPYTFSDWELRSTLDRNVGYHEKYMNGGNTGVFKNNSVCSSTHPHENSSATSV